MTEVTEVVIMTPFSNKHLNTLTTDQLSGQLFATLAMFLWYIPCLSLFFLFEFFSLDKLVKLVGRGSVINKATPSSYSNVSLYHTFRFWIHEITTIIETFFPGLDNNGVEKCSYNNFPGFTRMSVFLENCWKYIAMNCCSSIQGRRSLFWIKVGDRFVP